VNDRLKRRERGGLAQRFFEHRGRAIGAFEVCEKDEALDAPRADFRLGQQIGRDRLGACPFPGSVMRPSCSQRPTMTLVAPVHRRQPEGLLSELGRDGRSAAISSEPRAVVKNTCDVGVRFVSRKRKVTGAQERILDDFCDAPVNAPPLLAQVPVEDGRQQRVGEANRPVLALNHVGNGSRVERVCRNARLLQERLGRRAQRRGERKRVAGGCGEPRNPRAHELFERLGNLERLEWVEVNVEHAGQLQREERISARPLVDAEQCLAREGPAEPVAQVAVERADAEWSQRQPLDALRTKGLLEF
jgi:hypothetical protein